MISEATISKKAIYRHMRIKLYFALRLDGYNDSSCKENVVGSGCLFNRLKVGKSYIARDWSTNGILEIGLDSANEPCKRLSC